MYNALTCSVYIQISHLTYSEKISVIGSCVAKENQHRFIRCDGRKHIPYNFCFVFSSSFESHHVRILTAFFLQFRTFIYHIHSTSFEQTFIVNIKVHLDNNIHIFSYIYTTQIYIIYIYRRKYILNKIKEMIEFVLQQINYIC